MAYSKAKLAMVIKHLPLPRQSKYEMNQTNAYVALLYILKHTLISQIQLRAFLVYISLCAVPLVILKAPHGSYSK